MIQTKNIIKLILIILFGIIFLVASKETSIEVKEIFQPIGIVFIVFPSLILIYNFYKIFSMKKKISNNKIREIASTSMKIDTY